MALGQQQIIDTRIQLKTDTEANWGKTVLVRDGGTQTRGDKSFVPLKGEIIIYESDNEHAYTRLKVGDGETNVVRLPFIDAGTLNGNSAFILKYANFDAFPSPGSNDRLYIALDTDKVYHYTNATGYTPVVNFNVTRTSVSQITRWSSGEMTKASVSNNTLVITNGTEPSLTYGSRSVVSNVE